MTQIWHHYKKWECYKAGFYSSFNEAKTTKEEAQHQYKEFLSNLEWFEQSLKGVITEWKYSCEHFLTNPSINRIAWLGQASCAYAMGIPAEARAGFKLMSASQQRLADKMALKYLIAWEMFHEEENRKICEDMGQQRLFNWNS